MKKQLLISVFLLATLGLTAQDRVTTFGVQIKPIIPSNLLRTGTTQAFSEGVEYNMNQRVGYAFGGVIRKGLTNWLSLETGINYVRRNFEATVLNSNLSFSDSTRFRIIGYEIPVQGMVFVRLSDQIYMDGAFGVALNMFPSDVGSKPDNFYHRTFRNNGNLPPGLAWMQMGLLTNIGFELRTEDKGYFYVGATYHRPFRYIYDSELYHLNGGVEDRADLQLSGNYLTLDLRYYFHEDPAPRKIDVDEENLPSWMKYGKKK